MMTIYHCRRTQGKCPSSKYRNKHWTDGLSCRWKDISTKSFSLDSRNIIFDCYVYTVFTFVFPRSQSNLVTREGQIGHWHNLRVFFILLSVIQFLSCTTLYWILVFLSRLYSLCHGLLIFWIYQRQVKITRYFAINNNT